MDGSLKILVVDDEEIIVDIMTQMLQRLGYHTEGHTNGLSALEVFRKSPEDYGLVITDLTMPDVTGDRLAVEFKATRNDIPIVLSTGSIEKLNGKKLPPGSFQAVLMKPVSMHELKKTVRKIFDRRQSERRRDTRHGLRTNTIAVSKTDPEKQAEVIEISRSGFSLLYAENTNLPGQFEQLSIKTMNESVSLDDISYETISDISPEQESEIRPTVTRRRGGRFNKLTPSQSEQITLFIEKVAVSLENQRRCST